MTRNISIVLLGLAFCVPLLAAEAQYARNIASLIEPAKLTTLGERGANPRVQKAVYWMAMARQAGRKPDHVVFRAVALAGYKGPAASMTGDALLRNLDIAEKLGCLNPAGLSEMRRGNCATVTKGPYKGDELSVDHIIPRAVVPELDNVIANLELLPLKLNQKKNHRVGERQLSHAQKLHAAGLLSAQGLEKVRSAWSRRVHSRAGSVTPAGVSSWRMYRTAPHRWIGFSRPSFTNFLVVSREKDSSRGSATNAWPGCAATELCHCRPRRTERLLKLVN